MDRGLSPLPLSFPASLLIDQNRRACFTCSKWIAIYHHSSLHPFLPPSSPLLLCVCLCVYIYVSPGTWLCTRVLCIQRSENSLAGQPCGTIHLLDFIFSQVHSLVGWWPDQAAWSLSPSICLSSPLQYSGIELRPSCVALTKLSSQAQQVLLN